ncbi:MAG: NYN domain-containing protein [Verrucomicrobiae bacterium]|nr:NYN domain-containing protein [Verrucomicrobiae bacterium]
MSEHILVDGYSLIHQWDELRTARGRGAAAGRDALISALTRFHDSHGGGLTVVFDGQSVPKGGAAIKTGIQIVYSRAGESADAVIERMVGQSPRPADFLVATDDMAEQRVVEGFGAHTISAAGFRRMVEDDSKDLGREIKDLSRRNQGFSRRR